MEKVKIIIYEFLELDKKERERAISDYYSERNYDYLYHYLLDDLNDIDKYFSNVRLIYSLGHCQGDGLSFSGEFDLELWLDDKYTLKQSVKEALIEIIGEVSSTGNTGRYAYTAKNQITCDYHKYSFDMQNLENLKRLCEDVISHIEDYYVNLCERLEILGYKELDYRMDEEEFSEICKDNGYMFLYNGKMYSKYDYGFL